MVKSIPNTLTLINLSLGFLAVTALFRGDIVTAAWMVAAAMAADFLDGFAARVLKAESETGRQMDSLADIVSFGLVPGLMIYYLKMNAASGIAWHVEPVGINYGGINVYIFSMLFPVCAAIRLARFNSVPQKSTHFSGLPSPAAAFMIASVVLAARYGYSDFIMMVVSNPVALSLLSLITALLMVTPVNMLSLKGVSGGIRGSIPLFLLAAITILLFILLGYAFAALIVPAYVVISLIFCRGKEG